jgi:3-phosphoshikimate 1-carboxyvinyltransferase
MKTVTPACKPLRGTLSVPGDKSIAHRALLFGALCEGVLQVRNMPFGQDVLSTCHCLEAMGVAIRETTETLEIHGKGLRNPLRPPSAALDCGNSGTSMRLLMGVLAGQPFKAGLSGDASLSRRPMRRVAEPLRAMGAELSLQEGTYPPAQIHGRRPLKPISFELPVPSAQVKSAVLLAGLFAEGQTRITDNFATRDHSERMMEWLGGTAVLRRNGTSVFVQPSPLHAPDALCVPGDISSAAFFIGAALLVHGSDITVQGVGINPTRMGFVNALCRMGADVRIFNERESGAEPVADVRVRHSCLNPLQLKTADIPALVDEVPLLAVLASQADGESRFEGLAELRIKESDRLEGTARALRAMGADAAAEGDALVVPGGKRLRGGAVETYGDHRLAMAFTVAALAAEEETVLSDADCAAVSFPNFFAQLEALLS